MDTIVIVVIPPQNRKPRPDMSDAAAATTAASPCHYLVLMTRRRRGGCNALTTDWTILSGFSEGIPRDPPRMRGYLVSRPSLKSLTLR